MYLIYTSDAADKEYSIALWEWTMYKKKNIRTKIHTPTHHDNYIYQTLVTETDVQT